MKKALIGLAVAAAAVSAQADTKLSGHVNYVAGDFEDFNGNEDIDIHTASTSESRFRILSSVEANGITYGLREEFGLGEPGRANALNKRFNEVYAKGSFGKISLGQGSEAGDGATEEDFSGTYLLFGDLSSWNFNGAGAEGDFSDNNSRDIGRDERIRYDLPKFGPVAVALSYDDADNLNVAARATGKAWAAHVAVVSAEEDNQDVVEASVAGKFAGVTLALQYHTDENNADDNDIEQTRFIIGYNPGPFSVSVDFQQTEDDDDTVDAETTGLNFVYRPTKGVELYAGFRNAENNGGTSDEDGDGFLVGSRVKF